MSLGKNTKAQLLVLGAVLITAVAIFGFFRSSPAHAATGINQTIEFQGRLLNSQGATVADGYYNIEFKIYQDGDGLTAGDTTGSPAGSLKWTEDYLNYNTQGVKVVNGFFSVDLGSITAFGSSINWNQDTLWLSMNVAGTSTTCTTFSACTPDGEMLPMQRMTASPYSLNSGQLGGLTSGQFVWLGQGQQTDATTNSSIYINKTGTGNLLELQASGTDAFVLSNSGNLSFGNNATSHSISVATAAASTAGVSLSVTAGTAGSGASALSGGNLTLDGGTGGGTNGNGGNLILDAGVANGTGVNGSISIGTTNASSTTIGNTTGASGIALSVGTGNFTLNGVGASTYGIGAATTTGTITVGSTSQTGNLILQGEGITQTISGSATAPSELLQSSTNSSNAFGIKNSTGNYALRVDTTNNQLVLGQASLVNGAAVFKNSSGTNSITLNSTAANANYTLTLPSSAPNPGLCIETSNSSSSQLVFASCSNTNASITEVTEWDANATNSLPVSPSYVGDEIVLTTQIPTSGVTVSSISGGGVSTWNKSVVNNGNGTVNRVEMWVGTVTSTGSSTITVTYSASPGSEEITATEFTAAGVNASTTWGVGTTGAQINTSSSVVTFPSLNSINSSELYFGYSQVQNPPASAGSSSGFNYIVTSTQHNIITYNSSTNANTTYQPTANQSSAGSSNAIGAILTAFVTSTAINNSTSVQQANFYVQAATSGSVAGVLQANSGGTADILDLRASGNTNVASVGNTGIATFKNSANSASAFQVQNLSGTNILSVNTSANQLALGASSTLGGNLSFLDSSDTNSIALAAPSSIAASYTLTLPSNTPTAGLCLGTSPSNAYQLIFASCATQVSAGSISYVTKWDTSGSAVTSLAISPSNVGDLLLFTTHSANNVSVSSVSGGGVTTWSKTTSGANGTNAGTVELWRGVVTTAGSSTVTVTYSSGPGTNELVVEEFTMHSTNSTWAIDNSGVNYNTSTSTAINYPSLTPTNSGELYAGYGWAQNTMSAGSTTGYTYVATGAGHYLAYDTSVTGGGATFPTATQSTAGYYITISADIAGYTGTSVIVNTVSTQQANFNVQAATSGSVAGVLQAASSGTADIFDARNASGNNVVAINPSSVLTLGVSNSVTGQIIFNDNGNSNAITLTAPTAVGTSYTLTLPTTAPIAGECLASSVSNANQLVFSSCANQVTSVPITYVNQWTNSGNTVTTLAVAPTTLNDIMVLFSSPANGNGSINSISGGGVTSWTKVTSTTSGSGAGTTTMDMWKGVVTSTGSSTITVTFGGTTGNPNVITAMEFSTGSTSGSWVVDSSGTQYNGTASTTVTYPSLTPQSSKDLYVGYASGGAMSAGTNTGFTYTTTSNTSRQDIYNTSVSSTTQPTSVDVSSASLTIGALIAAYSSSSVIANSTVTQTANFNVQAATSGSIAGILQANGGGTADIFDALSGSGSLVDSIGYSGNLTVKPSIASASALQIQTTGGVNVLSVDTSGLKVNIGAGSTGEGTPSLLVLDNETGTSSDPTEADGAMYYNATDRSFRCGVAGSWETCTGLLYSNSSTSTANSNCSNNCAAFSTAAAVPANYCQTGKVITLTGNGYYSSGVSVTNLQFGIYYGTSSTTATSDTLVGSLTPAISATAAANYYFQINYNIICFATSSMEAEGTISAQNSTSNTSSLLLLPIASTTSTTVTTNTANNLYIFPIWGTASTSNTATMTQMIVNGY